MTSGTNGGFVHTVFGLRLRSALALPELARVADDGSAADVVVEWGRVTERLEGAVDVEPAMQVAATHFQLDVPVGRFRVSEGRRVLIDARPAASDDDLRPYLLGTVMGAVCHQRGFLSLHAAAVLSEDGATAFAGPSGAGKSTLAAQFHARGRGVLADDLLAVEIDANGAARALPGLARIRLHTGSPGGADGKVSLPIAGRAPAPASPLRRLCVLRVQGAGPPKVCRLRGPEAVSAILGQIYRWPIAVAMARAPACFAQSLALAERCEVFEVSFAHTSTSPCELVDTLEAHLTR